MAANDISTAEDLQSFISQQRSLISRTELKPFTRRTDSHGLIYLAIHFAGLGATGWLIYLSLGNWWLLVPAMFVHGVVLNQLFAPLHEVIHGTTFRTRWLNELVMYVLGFMIVWMPIYFRYEHTAHHTNAQIKGKDAEFVLPSAATKWQYFLWVCGHTRWTINLGWLFLHSMGRMRPEERQNVPDNELSRIYFEARLMLALYVAIGVGAVIAQSWAPMIYWLIPLTIGRPVQHAIRAADHAGCLEGSDMTRNVRTVITDPVTQFLCWNMNFHTVHHLVPSAPFHALPALHDLVGHKLYNSKRGYWAAQLDIIRHHLTGRLQDPALLPDDGRRPPQTAPAVAAQ
jgi:fatty acid desaturase